jgi:hypothetical protein
MTSLVETDARSRLTLPGHPNQRFLVRENADGSFLLEPAVRHRPGAPRAARESGEVPHSQAEAQAAARHVSGGTDYSAVAIAQLDALERGGNPGLYNAILDACDLIFATPLVAQATSTAISTDDGIVMAYPVPGEYPYRVFWRSDGPRIEAVFTYDRD